MSMWDGKMVCFAKLKVDSLRKGLQSYAVSNQVSSKEDTIKLGPGWLNYPFCEHEPQFVKLIATQNNWLNWLL